MDEDGVSLKHCLPWSLELRQAKEESLFSMRGRSSLSNCYLREHVTQKLSFFSLKVKRYTSRKSYGYFHFASLFDAVQLLKKPKFLKKSLSSKSRLQIGKTTATREASNTTSQTL